MPGQLSQGQECRLDPADSHKLRTVLRAAVGEFVEVRDSTAAVFECVILGLLPEVTVRLERRCEQPAMTELAISLAQCLPKGSKMDYVVEKATELGVIRFLPVQSERVIGAREGTGKLDRWRRLARAAAAQSGALAIPEVSEVVDWSGLLALMPGYDRVLIPWEIAPTKPRALDALVNGASSVLVVIGPEGGLSYREIERAQAVGAQTLSLGRRILRSETAGLVAISAIRYAAGEV